MIENLGWIKLHRDMKTHPIFTSSDPKQLKFWLLILLSVNHEEKRLFIQDTEVVIKQGQMLTSYESLVEKFNKVDGKLIPKAQRLSLQTVRTYIERFTKWGMINKQSTNRFSLVEVCNWTKYQDKSTGNQQATNKLLTTNKNDKNDKNNIYSSKECLTDELCKEVANEYSVNFKAVCDIRDDLKGYHQKKYKNYKATLQNWTRKAIRNKQIFKITKTEVPYYPPISQAEREQGMRILSEAREKIARKTIA